MTYSLRDTLQEALGSGYVIKAELGGGGMSRVFVAHEEALGRDVVVKVLAPELAEGLSVERFTREIRLAAALQEPHIVPVLTAGVTALGMPYYTMPFVRGASLRELMARGTVPTADAADLLRDVARALAYAHSQGIIHRDIKPENILISSATAVVTDFGIAKALEVSRTAAADGQPRAGITRTGTSLGTPAYMAPEQAAGDPTMDQRADLYSWGVVAYELLAGRHPFVDSTSPQALLTAHMVQRPVGLSTMEHVPTELAVLVMQCLEKDPADRPASATVLVQQMTDVRTSGSRERGPGSISREPVKSQRPWLRHALIPVGVTAAAVALLSGWWSTRRAPAAATGPVMMAVLPFEHAGPVEQQPFTDGLTDAVTAKLSGLSSLLVIDRRSSATYRGTAKSTQQIGQELKVRYLLEGVVRWAKDGAGVWHARVTPTLVDARSGAITWTGDPAEVTLDDPFTAQGTIATDVTQAMELALLPKERIALKRSITDNPQAYMAYLRGQSQVEDSRRSFTQLSPDWYERVAKDFAQAIAFDSSFGYAWAGLVDQRLMLAIRAPADTSALAEARRLLRMALARAPDDPRVQMQGARIAWLVDHDTTAAFKFVEMALRLAPNDAAMLTGGASFYIATSPKRAGELAMRAARLDPRSIRAWQFAATAMLSQHKADTALILGERMLAVDSTDERGWIYIFQAHVFNGDTLALRHASSRMLRNVPQPSVILASYMVYADTAKSRRLLASSPETYRVRTLSDSINDIWNRLTAALVLRDERLTNVHAMSLITTMTKDNRHLQASGFNRVILAWAQARVGRTAEARATLLAAIADARKRTGERYPVRVVHPDGVASVYGLLGEPNEAIVWMEEGIKRTFHTVHSVALHPACAELRNTSAYATFLRRHATARASAGT